jgi:hypothetical protein
LVQTSEAPCARTVPTDGPTAAKNAAPTMMSRFLMPRILSPWLGILKAQ